jgi:hypothetical protein
MPNPDKQNPAAAAIGNPRSEKFTSGRFEGGHGNIGQY